MGRTVTLRGMDESRSRPTAAGRRAEPGRRGLGTAATRAAALPEHPSGLGRCAACGDLDLAESDFYQEYIDQYEESDF